MLYPVRLFWSLCSTGVSNNAVLPIVPVWISLLCLLCFLFRRSFCLGHCEWLLNSVTGGTVMICPQPFLMSLRVSHRKTALAPSLSSLTSYSSSSLLARLPRSHGVFRSEKSRPLHPHYCHLLCLTLSIIAASSPCTADLSKGQMLEGMSNLSLLQCSVTIYIIHNWELCNDITKQSLEFSN